MPGRTRKLSLATWLVVPACSALALTGTVLAAGASTPADASTVAVTYRACLNHADHTLYGVTVSPASPAKCKKGDAAVTWNQTGPAGQPGKAGAQGPQGPAGSAGKTGAAGPQGPAGPDGKTGAQGSQGPAGKSGAAGPQGPAGADGKAGAQGPAGPDGKAGAQGPAGPDGNTGPAGPQGPAGATGPAGPGAVAFTAVGQSTYTVPAGVTKLFIELVGGGGGGSGTDAGIGSCCGAGGGQGGQATVILPVTAGAQIVVTVGDSGPGGLSGLNTCADGTKGKDSTVTVDNTVVAIATGGGGGNCSSSVAGGLAGTATVSPPAIGFEQPSAKTGSASGNGGGAPGFAGTGGSGADIPNSVIGSPGTAGAVEIIPAN
jgi:hypothetical protein